MKLAYTHPNIALVVQAQAVLDRAGIKCVMRNEYAAGAIGELAPISAWPEVWVVEDSDLERATGLVEESQRATTDPDWQCDKCSSSNPANFETCWNCGSEGQLV